MKKKIVIKVGIHNEKCKSKAMKIAALAQGVSSVSIEGKEGDQLVVTGDGVDPVCLTKSLRKKFRFATIISVQDVKAEDAAEKKTNPIQYLGYYSPCPPPNPYSQVVYDPYPNNCSIK